LAAATPAGVANDFSHLAPFRFGHSDMLPTFNAAKLHLPSWLAISRTRLPRKMSALRAMIAA
jgi:hypothetical protein